MDYVCKLWARAVPDCGCVNAGKKLCSAVNAPKFVGALPLPDRIDLTNPNKRGGKNSHRERDDKDDPYLHQIWMQESVQNTGVYFCDETGVSTGESPSTAINAYGYYDKTGAFKASFPGPTFEGMSGDLTQVKYFNELNLRHPQHPWIVAAVDYHVAEISTCSAENRRFQKTDINLGGTVLTNHGRLGEEGCVPTVPHVHGGFTIDSYDGSPDSWWLDSDLSQTYVYENEQEAGMLWIHDHSLGLTGVNVHSGLALMYALRDDNEIKKFNSASGGSCGLSQYDPTDVTAYGSKGGRYGLKGCEVELAIADRTYDDAGNWMYTTGEAGEVIQDAEYFGDHNLVNGAAWPVLEIPSSWMRLRLLNAADSRLYALQLVAECPGADAETVEMILIGRDQGFLNTSKVIPGGLVPRGLTDPTVTPGLKSLEAAFINQYLLLPNGGRADVLVDFSIFADTCEFKMINNASNGPMSIDEPLMLQPTAEELATVGQVMAFRFAQSADAAAKVRADGKVKYAKKQLRADKFSMPAEFRRPDYFRDEVYGISSMNLVDIPQPQPANNPKSRALFLSEFDEFVPALGETRLKPSLGAFINGKLYPALSWCADDLVRAGEDPLSERPVLGTSEEWAIYNISPDMHPVHLHLVAFEVHRRCPLALPTDTELQACWDGVSEDPETEAESLALEAATLCDAQVRATAAIQTDLNSPQCLVAVDEGEDGPLDIAMSWNGYATVIRTSFDKEGSYVWHCHILSHEDNEMMRPLCVTKPGAANGYDSCQDYYSACGYDTTGLRTNGSAPVPAILELGAR